MFFNLIGGEVLGKYIIDKLKDKRIDIDLGGHWENLMDYIKKEYPEFYTWSDKDKDNWILEHFEFKETNWKRVNYLGYGYVREFSDSSKGYRLNTTIRDKKDKEELTDWLQEISTKTATAFERMYLIFYKVEKVMRERKIKSAYNSEGLVDGLLISFELKDDGFSVDFVSLYDEECRIIASFARNSINEPLIPKMGVLDFYGHFGSIVAYTDRLWEEIETSFADWLEDLEENKN